MKSMISLLTLFTLFFCRGQRTKYLLCSLLLFRYHTWAFQELQGHRTYIIWSLTRSASLLLTIIHTEVTAFWNYVTHWYFWMQFVSPFSLSHIYSEKLVHLPHCYFVNDYKQVSPFFFDLTYFSLVLLIQWTRLFFLFPQKNRDVLDPNCQLKRSDCGLPEDKFIFACFNQLYKMDPDIFNTW